MVPGELDASSGRPKFFDAIMARDSEDGKNALFVASFLDHRALSRAANTSAGHQSLTPGQRGNGRPKVDGDGKNPGSQNGKLRPASPTDVARSRSEFP